MTSLTGRLRAASVPGYRCRMSSAIIEPLMAMHWSLGAAFGVLALVLHLIAYAWYALCILRGRTRPNAASWSMWLFGAWVEYVTYDAIDSHWATSALPFACFLGCCAIFVVTAALQLGRWFAGSGKVVYEPARRHDFWAMFADAVAYGLYLATGGAAWANVLAVSTTVITFIPIWRTTLRHGHEQPGPWLVWCTAYLAMLGAVIAGPREQLLAQAFYPVYYFLLSLVVALLSFENIRVFAGRRLPAVCSVAGRA